MDKQELKIVIIDDSVSYYKILKSMLKKIGFENIEYFQSPLEFIEYFKQDNRENIDIVFIDYEMPHMNGLKILRYIHLKYKDILTVMITGVEDNEIKEKAIKFGVNEFMSKNIDFFSFQTKVNLLANLRFYYCNTLIQHKKLQNLIKYKNTQETLASYKQLKIIEDNLSNHYYGKWLVNSFFKPKDVLSGDSYLTKQIDEDRFFFSIVDGMGKGISASLSSILMVSFIGHSLCKSLNFNDFKFDRLVEDAVNYAQSILLDDEALSFALIEVNIKTMKIKYLNMGLPPFFLKKETKITKIKPNNIPLLPSNKSFKIDEIQIDFDTFLFFSDGLFESISNVNNYPYFIRFEESYKNAFILKDIVNDFKAEVPIPDDDTTIICLKKDIDKYKTFYEEKILLKKQSVDFVLNNIEEKLEKLGMIKEKIIFILHELLINSYEHSALKIVNKHQVIQEEQNIEDKGEEKFAYLNIQLSEKFVIILLEDEGDGFDINKILKTEWFSKYHGRGVKMIKSLSDGMFYNKEGNKVKIYLKL